MMRARFSLATLALVLLVPAAQAQGALRFETTEHDFGEITEGEEPSVTFTFTNTGDRAVRLLEVRPSCGCTTPLYSRGDIAPGETGVVEVAYASAGRPGPFRKSVAVTAGADGMEPARVTLRIRGNVLPQSVSGDPQGVIVIQDASADIGGLRVGAPFVHRFTMQHMGERPVRFTAARVAGGLPADVVYPSSPVFPGDVFEVAVGMDAAPAGPFEIAVEVQTDDAAQPVKTLSVRGTGETR